MCFLKMAHAHVPRRVPRLAAGALAGGGGARGRRPPRRAVRAPPPRRPPHSARQPRAPLHQLAAALHLQIVCTLNTPETVVTRG